MATKILFVSFERDSKTMECMEAYYKILISVLLQQI